MDVAELEVPNLGESFYIGTVDRPANLSDIASLTMALATRIEQSINRKLDSVGITSPCCKGCAVCCHLLVLLSVPEAIHLAEGVMTKMSNRQRDYLIESCHERGEYMREQLPGHLVRKSTDNTSESELGGIAAWYRQQRLPCAFLQDGLCTVYDHRPIACRAFAVVGQAGQCQLDGITNVKQVTPRPLYLTHVLGRLVSELEHARRTGIFLHDVFAWYMENQEIRNLTWPATMMVERFVDIVKSTVQKNFTLRNSVSICS
jgi:Fe-S-cluster containining protein